MVKEQPETLKAQYLPDNAANNISIGADPLADGLRILAKLGSFEVLESAIEGIQNMNPERKLRKRLFLIETARKTEREELAKKLRLWKDVLTVSEDIVDTVQVCREKSEAAGQLLKSNLKVAIRETHDLERSYRSVSLFFKNTECQKVKNVSFMDVAPEQLQDLDNTRFIDAIHHELRDNYDRLDLSNNYSLLVIPGYLGSGKVVEKWARIAYENKVLLVTDFQDLESPDDMMEMFEAMHLTGAEVYRSNVVMTANYIVARGKIMEVDEEEDLVIPPSAALAGKIYNTLMSQVTAGVKHGTLIEVAGVRADMKKSEIADLEKLGLLPIVKEFSKVMPFSAKTLFNGDNLGLQTYSVVRVFDYIAKVMMHFLNQRTFENFTAHTKNELNKKIVSFLNGKTGHNKLIEGFSIKRFEQDPVQKDKIYLEIHLTPYFPAKTFLIKLEGQKVEDGKKGWSSAIEQK